MSDVSIPRRPLPERPTPTFTTIDEVLAHRFIGNAYSDLPAFQAIDTFIRQPTVPAHEKKIALWWMGHAGMGLDPDQSWPDDIEIENMMGEHD